MTKKIIHKVAEFIIKRVIFYGRVSTDEQAKKDHNSLETQEIYAERCIGLHEHDGWQKVRSILDPGYSAKDLKRPGMRELIELVKSGEVDVIVVYKLDRLTRSISDFYELWKVLEKHNVELVSATEQLDTSTPMGRAFLNLLLTFAQFEREMTSQRLNDKFAEEAKQGLKHPGPAPYGYRLDKKNRSMIPIPEEAKFVKLMYELMVRFRSTAAVAEAVNAQGSRTKNRIYKSGTEEEEAIGGGYWIGEKIKRLIQRHDYKGIRVHNGEEYTAVWQPIVSKKLWQQANDALIQKKNPTEPQPDRNKHEMALKGILKCGHCGCAMSPKPGGKKDANGEQRPYYTCQDVIRYGSKCNCDVRSLPGKPFDAFISKCIGELGRNPDVIKATIKGASTRQKKSLRPLKSELAAVKKQVKELDLELSNCLSVAKAKGAGNFTNTLLREADELSQKRQLAEKEQQRLKNEIELILRATTDESLVAEALRNFEALFAVLPFEDRLALMERLVSEIRVSRIEPEKFASELPEGTFVTQIRTSWYQVELDFFIKSLFRTPSKKKFLVPQVRLRHWG